MGLAASLAGAQIEPLLRDALDMSALTGTGNVQVNLTTQGADFAAARRKLDGTAALQLRDGAIKGADLAGHLREARERLRGIRGEPLPVDLTQKTDFTDLNATFTIRGGVLRNDDLEARSPLLRIAGGGSIDLAAERIDYTARVSLTGPLLAADGREIDELRGLTVPVRFAGPFAQPSYEIDWAAAAQNALKTRAAERLMQKVTRAADTPGKGQGRARHATQGSTKP